MVDSQRPGERPDEEGEAREAMPTAAPEQDALVPFSTRVKESTRRRARIYAAANDLGIQEVVEAALEEYLRQRGA